MDWAHLAIGAEILWGDTLNTHSQTLARWLRQIGYRMKYHMACDDRVDEILACLNFLKQASVNIIITGGLGPTADDVTRQALAQAFDVPLELNDEAWEHVQAHLTSRGVVVRDSHRQEALVPKNSYLFKNTVGTACGFAFYAQHRWIVVLPGPSRELKQMWPQVEDFLKSHLQAPGWQIQSFWVAHAVESQVDAVVKDFLEHHQLHFEFYWGLKLDIPYVEVRFWFKKHEVHDFQWEKFWSDLLQRFAPWLVIENKNDLPIKACKNLGIDPNHQIIVMNQPSEYLVGRFRPLGFRFCETLLNEDLVANGWFWIFDEKQKQLQVIFPNRQTRVYETRLNPQFSWFRHERFLIESVLWDLSQSGS